MLNFNEGEESNSDVPIHKYCEYCCCKENKMFFYINKVNKYFCNN